MSVERELGVHDEAIETLKDEVKALRGDVAELKAIMNAAQGGWKTVVAIAGMSSVVGAAVFKLFSFLHELLPK